MTTELEQLKAAIEQQAEVIRRLVEAAIYNENDSESLCLACNGLWWSDMEEEHQPDCPVLLAKVVLAETQPNSSPS